MSERAKPPDVIVDADFPGGNIVVETVHDDRVRLRPDLRDTEGNWFYWHFRVRGAAGRTLRFEFTSDNPIGVRGPAISRDDGWTWEWLGAAACQASSFVHAFGAGEDNVRFSVGMPYVEMHLRRFLAPLQGHPALREDDLCLTPKGRRVERLLLGCLHREPAARILIVARHHACEMMASYVLEGLVEAILTADNPAARLREQAQVWVVPFMDKDGVEDGDQGKNRRPHDHNRDYGESSRYVSTRALRSTVPAWSAGKLRVALDLHCPWIRGEWNELIYQVGSPLERIYHEQVRFADCLERACTGPLPCPKTNILPHGESWNREPPDSRLCTFSRWSSQIPGIRLAGTIEVPYANAQGHEVNAATARAFGRDLARALAMYLEFG